MYSTSLSIQWTWSLLFSSILRLLYVKTFITWFWWLIWFTPHIYLVYVPRYIHVQILYKQVIFSIQYMCYWSLILINTYTFYVNVGHMNEYMEWICINVNLVLYLCWNFSIDFFSDLIKAIAKDSLMWCNFFKFMP